MKNDWVNNDTGFVWRMNQPFALASGGYNAGNTQLTLYVTPGRMRYPLQSKTVYSGQPQAFAIPNPQAAKFYTIFMRSTGAFEVSGAAALSPVPSPIHRDAEYLGQVYTGASLGAANLIGPWSNSTFNPYEQRGEITAAAQPRLYYDDSPATGWPGSMDATAMSTSLSSGLAWGSPMETADAAGVRSSRTLLYGSVEWVASGALVSPGYISASGTLTIAPFFTITKVGSLTTYAVAYDTRTFYEPQNPDRANTQKFTTVMVGETDGGSGLFGLMLGVGKQPIMSVSGGLRVTRVHFGMLPGLVISSDPDKRQEPA